MKSALKKVIVLQLLFLPFLINGQSLQFNKQYLVNKYVISPAYAGFSSNSEFFLSNGKTWKGIDGAPELRSINFNSNLKGRSGCGAFLTEKSEGIFSYLSMGLSYSYGVTIKEGSQLVFGTSFEYFENKIDISYSDQPTTIDPKIAEYQNLKETYVNSSLGVLYVKRNLNVGFVLLNLGNLYNKGLKTDNNDNIFRAHISYLKPISKYFDVEAFAILSDDATKAEALLYDFALDVKVNQLFWLGASYRNPSTYGFLAGVNPFNRLLIQYSYETSNSGIANMSSGGHEISIGIMLGNHKDVKYHRSSFCKKSKTPYDSWVK